jgi:hypothetical protein
MRERIIALIAASLIGCVAMPAAAQDFFSALFGSLFRPPTTRSAPPLPYFDPRGDTGDGSFYSRGSDESAGGAAFCVRLCDGRYFPVNGGSAAVCDGFCPAAKTAVLWGDDITDAQASDGTRYDEFANAYVYRDKLVDGCTCNGTTPYGLATVDIQSDPTLRRGDIVATDDTLTVFTGRTDRAAIFTPITRPEKLRDAYRRKFAVIAPGGQGVGTKYRELVD